MKAKVVKPFSDAENLANTYNVGDEFSGSAERVTRLEEGGYVKAAGDKGGKSADKK